MDKVFCQVLGVSGIRGQRGTVLEVEYQPDPSYDWERVRQFFSKGKFALKFDGENGMTTLRDVTVSTAVSAEERRLLLVELDQNEPKRVPSNCSAWLEKM